jgi:hypothetical protein
MSLTPTSTAILTPYPEHRMVYSWKRLMAKTTNLSYLIRKKFHVFLGRCGMKPEPNLS